MNSLTINLLKKNGKMFFYQKKTLNFMSRRKIVFMKTISKSDEQMNIEKYDTYHHSEFEIDKTILTCLSN